jgi:hypothetical protein
MQLNDSNKKELVKFIIKEDLSILLRTPILGDFFENSNKYKNILQFWKWENFFKVSIPNALKKYPNYNPFDLTDGQVKRFTRGREDLKKVTIFNLSDFFRYRLKYAVVVRRPPDVAAVVVVPAVQPPRAIIEVQVINNINHRNQINVEEEPTLQQEQPQQRSSQSSDGSNE